MDILTRTQLIKETVDTIEINMFMAGGSTTNWEKILTIEKNKISYSFSYIKTYLILNVDLISNCIRIVFLAHKGLNPENVLKIFNSIDSTPKEITNTINNHTNVYWDFKISKRNCQRLYDISRVMLEI